VSEGKTVVKMTAGIHEALRNCKQKMFICGVPAWKQCPCAIPYRKVKPRQTKPKWLGNLLNWGKGPSLAMTRTTNRPGHPGYIKDNIWGDDMWRVEMEMDCSRTNKGYFEFSFQFKGKHYKKNIKKTCLGNVGGLYHHKTPNFWGKCGFTNKVVHGDLSHCVINKNV